MGDQKTTGYEKFMELKAKASKMKSQGKLVADFSIGDPKDPKNPLFLEELKKAVLKMTDPKTVENSRAVSGYPKYTGEDNYKQSCSKYMKNRFDLDINWQTEICATRGCKPAINTFLLSIINDETDIVIIPTPGYPPYISGTHDAGGNVHLVPLLEENGFMLDYNSIDEEIAQKAKIIIVNYPNSPTGVVASLAYYKGLVEWAAKNNIIIMSDEGCYIDLAYDRENQPCSVLNAKPLMENIIAFYSWSKSHNMTGDCLGFVAGDENLINKFKKKQNARDKNTPSYIQDAAAISMLDTNFTDYMVSEYKKRKDVLLNALREIGFDVREPDAAFYIWQKLPESVNALDFANALLDLGIVVTPGEFLAQEVEGHGNLGKDYVRFALVPKYDEVSRASKIMIEAFKGKK